MPPACSLRASFIAALLSGQSKFSGLKLRFFSLLRRRSQSESDQLCMLHIHICLQDLSAQAAYRVQYHIHIRRVVQYKNGGCPWLHQPLHFPDKIVADSSRGQDGGGAGASHHSTDSRTGDWSADYQAYEKSHTLQPTTLVA